MALPGACSGHTERKLACTVYNMEANTSKRRRKWDVAAPQGIPLHGNRAGIGSSGSSASAPGAGGLITAQGIQVTPSPAQPVASPQTTASPGAAAKPAQPIDKDTIARAQLGAAAIVAKLNQVRVCSASSTNNRYRLQPFHSIAHIKSAHMFCGISQTITFGVPTESSCYLKPNVPAPGEP